MCAKLNITKESMDIYLCELAKEYKKSNKNNILIEIVIVGGASILANYGFRETTVDIDAVMESAFGLKDAIRIVADKYNLSYDWLNGDFMKTKSYSKKLREYSTYYKTFSNCIEIRTVKAEYLIAMKLVAGRRYKKDISDIIGILEEQKKLGKALEYSQIDRAVIELYGSWDNIDKSNIEILNEALVCSNLRQMYRDLQKEEERVKKDVLEIDKKYPNLIKANNINDIIMMAKEKGKKN